MAELDPDEVAAPEAKTVDTAPVTAPEAPPVPEAPVSLRDPAVEIPPLLKRPAVVEQDPAEANLDAIPVSPREQAKKEAAATITEFNAGKRPELTQDQLQNLELIAADDKTGYDRMYDALWEGVKDVPDVIKAAKEWATRPHQPTPEEEEKIRTRREELIASGHSTIQAEQEAEREFRREATERGARELAQGGLMAGVGLPSFVQDIGVGTGDVLSSPLQVLPGIGPYIKGNIARNRAQADILKHHSERLASWIAEKTGVSRDTAASMFGENMAYMLLPGSELATAADMSRAIKAGLSYSRGLTGTAAEVAKGVLAKSAPVLEKGVKTAGAAVAGGAFDTIVKSVTGFDTHHLGAWLTGEGALLKLARSSPEITDKIYKSVTDMPASEFAKKSFEIAREKPLGQPINDFLGDFSRQKAVARSQEADALKATMKPADVVAASDKAVDGTWKIQDDNLTPEAKKLRTVLDDVSDLHNKADIAYRQGKLSKLLEFGANVSGNVAAHTAQAGLLGAAFTGPSATTGEAGPAVGTGMAVGAVLGTGAAPLTVPAGMRAGRLKAGDIALFNRGKDKIRGDISVLNPDDQRRMVKYAGFLDSMGATLHVHSPDELRAMQGLPASASPGAGFVSENGKDVYLNSDSIPRGGGNIPGVEAHEFTHVTERFLGETLRKLAPEHMKEFETQYGQALNTTGQTGFNSRSERDAEVGRLVLQNTPIDYFYGGATGGDIIKDRLSRIFGGMLGKNGVKTINGFEAPYTPRDILDMRKRFLKAGEAASREGVTPSAADHKTWSPDQQNIVKQWTKSYVDKGMSPNDAANKVAEDIQSITKGPPPEPEPEEPHVSTGAPAGPAQKPDNVDWINFPEEKPYYKEGGFSYMPEKVKPITKEEARGNSRPVAQDEFDKLAEIGQRKLASLQKDPSPPTGLDDNWNNIKQNTWLKAQADWGGDTIDAHTGKSVTPAEKSGPFSLTVREPGQDSVVIPQDATQEQFNKAMDTARQRFGKQLSYKDHHLGVFHDNDKGTIDIDPVLVVKNAGDVQTIGAYTHAVGGAFDYATGNGYFPPHVDPSLPSLIGKRTGAGGVWDSTFVSGEGEEMRQDLAKQLGANPDKHFYEQKPAVQKAITEHFKDTGEAQYMPQVKDFQDLAKDAGYEFQGDLDGVLFWKNKEGKEITAEPWRGRASAIQDFKDKLSGKYEAGQDLSKYSKSQAYGLYGERSRLKREGETQFMPSPAGELNWTRRQYDMTPDQLEQFLVFGKSVAGKRSAIQAPMIERFMTDLLDKHGGTSPLAALQKAAQEPGGIEELVRKHKFSPYESSIPFLKHLAENRIPDLRNITEEELQNIPHIGPKTARFFKMHTDATRANNVALDTHILSWLRDNGFGDAPKSTPQDPATYQLWSDKFRDAAKELGTTPNDLDLRIWLDRSGNLPKETYQQLKSIGASRQFMPEKDDYRGYIMRTPLHEHVSRVGGIDEPRIYVANTKEPSEPFKGTYQHLAPIGKGQENVSFLNPKVIAHVQGGVPYLRAMAKEAQAQGHDGLVILSKNAALPADVDQVGLGHYPEAKKAFYMNDKDFAEWAKKNPDKLDWENPRNVYVPLEGPQSSMAERAAAQNAPKQPFKETPTQKFRRQIRETGEPRPEDRAGEWWKKEGGTPLKTCGKHIRY